MSDRRVGAILSLLRQSISIGADFGAHPLEALLWVAETVEGSVYEPGSLRRTGDVVSFALANPPLRSGAFSSARVSLGGQFLAAQDISVREDGRPWRTADSLSRAAPLRLAPGVRTEFRLRAPPPIVDRPLEVRLELESVAIPPLVWFEFRDSPGELGGA
jgi:hypothetical protein